MPVSSSSSLRGQSFSSLLSRARSALSVSAWELTDTYSPAAIDMAPATAPAIPAMSTLVFELSAAATPEIRLAVERMPSLAPSTAARSHPTRPLKWSSAPRSGQSVASPLRFGVKSFGGGT
ncbi:protein of unknown function [Hyphomicrobium sp. 1Nfss2.1]